jgi:hypothetical protein
MSLDEKFLRLLLDPEVVIKYSPDLTNSLAMPGLVPEKLMNHYFYSSQYLHVRQ